jgi:hypothetical protein
MAEEQSFSWASLIPEVYFDLIARVPAGATIVVATIGHSEPLQIKAILAAHSFGPVFMLTLLVLLVSYVLGLLLTPLSGAISLTSRRIIWFKWRRIQGDYPDFIGLCRGFGFSVSDSPFLSELVKLELEMHEFLGIKNEDARSLLPKMRAEAELCNNLSVALFAVMVCDVILHGTSATTACLLLLSLYVAAVGAYRIWRLLDRQVILLRVLRLIDMSSAA